MSQDHISRKLDDAIERLIDELSAGIPPDDMVKYASAIDKLVSARATDRGVSGSSGLDFAAVMANYEKLNQQTSDD